MTESWKGRRICMGVWNSMRHDARVARSAGTLVSTEAGVTVVAASWDAAEAGRAVHDPGFHVITVSRPPPSALAAGSRGVSLGGALWRLVRAVPSQWRFMSALWQSRADIYHAHDLQALPWVWLVAKLRRRPVIYDAHEISTDRTALQRIGNTIARIEGFLARRCEAMIATTDLRADHFVRQYGVRRPVVLQNRPHFVDVRRTNRLREALGIPGTAPIVLYQGGMQRGRGLPALVDQIPHLPGAHFVFLGDGMLKHELETRVRDHGVTDRAHFLPAVPWQELAEWTASADIGVQLIENTGLNHYTTDSNKLFEYAMAGLAVVASDFPEIRRIVVAHEFGELVDPARNEEVHAALRRLIDDDALRARYAGNAWNARRELAWETQAPALIGLYRRLFMSERKPGVDAHVD